MHEIAKGLKILNEVMKTN